MITKKEDIMINIKNICITKKKLKIDKLINGEEKILITIKDNMLDINKEWNILNISQNIIQNEIYIYNVQI